MSNPEPALNGFEAHEREQLFFTVRNTTPEQRLQWLEELLPLLARYLKDRRPKSGIQPVVAVHKLNDPEADRRDVRYWLTRPFEERIETLDFLRRQFYGNPTRFQRTAQVIQRP